MMKTEQFDSSKSPDIVVTECSSELVIRGWDDREVLAKGEDFEVQESESGFTISSRSRLRLMVPAGANLKVNHVKGDLVVKNVAGFVELHETAGDAVLMGLGEVTVHNIHNDLSVKRIDGIVHVKQVHGDVLARQVGGMIADIIHGDLSAHAIDGSVQLGEVMGDISVNGISGDLTISKGRRDANLRGLGGQVTVSDIAGDIRLQGELIEGKHSCMAAGDIVLRWPDEAPLDIVAEAASIVNRLELDEVSEAEGSLTGNIAGSQTFVLLKAKGSIVLKPIQTVDEKWDWGPGTDFQFDFDGSALAEELAGLGEQISVQVNEKVARLTADLENRFGPEFSQKMAEKINRQAERAAAKAEKAAERAMRRAERSMRHSLRRRRTTTSRRGGTQSSSSRKATSEEQLKILKMVEKGIITTDEASTLLEALES